MSDINRGWTRATPSMAPLKPAGLTAEFLKEPLNFMRRHSMSPPDDFGYLKEKGHNPHRTQHTDVGGTLATTSSTMFERSSSGVQVAHNINRKSGGGIYYVKFVKHETGNFPNAVTLQVLPRVDRSGARAYTDGTYLPIHWLPWQSLSLVEYKIPEVPSSEADPQDDEYPRFFFTAGINGCSVFASGSANSPTVTHAGVSGATILGSAGEFWRQQMAKTGSGYMSSAIHGEINTHDYMYAGQKPEQKKLIKDYSDWLSTGGEGGKFVVEAFSPFGCVFGIRYGRMWTLYLQKSAVFEELTFYKQKDVTSDNKLKSTGQSVTFEQARSVFEPKKLGPLTIGQKQTKVFSTSRLFSMPMQVVDFFPNSHFTADLKQSFKMTRNFKGMSV